MSLIVRMHKREIETMISRLNKYSIFILLLFILGCSNSLDNIIDYFEDQYDNEGVLCQDGKIFKLVDGEFKFHHRIANRRDFVVLIPSYKGYPYGALCKNGDVYVTTGRMSGRVRIWDSIWTKL